jgi:hypothetical protein
VQGRAREKRRVLKYSCIPKILNEPLHGAPKKTKLYRNSSNVTALVTGHSSAVLFPAVLENRVDSVGVISFLLKLSIGLLLLKKII